MPFVARDTSEHGMSHPARNASANLSEESSRNAKKPGLPEFLAMLDCQDDAARRVAALESLGHIVFEATDGNEAGMILRKVILMLKDPVWAVK